jgi:hypothetical protein
MNSLNEDFIQIKNYEKNVSGGGLGMVFTLFGI